jgi:hypothetical protein
VEERETMSMQMLRAAIAAWDDLLPPEAMLREKISFPEVLTRRAQVMNEIIGAAKLILAGEAKDADAPAARDVLIERARQMSVEGWTFEHDDEHVDGSLALAAVCYALPFTQRYMEERSFERDVGRTAGEPIIIHDKVSVPGFWPQSWHGGWWKPRGRRRDLVRAAALLIAEIERLDRAGEAR